MKKLIIFLLLCPQISMARTMFEPSLGLTYGGYDGPISGADLIANGTPIQATYTTLSAGVRYGITREYIQVTAVADAHLMSLSTDVEVNTDTQVVPGLGLGIGYEWNIPLRTFIVIGDPVSGVELSYYWSESMLIGLRYNSMQVEFDGADLTVDTVGVAITFPIEFDYPSHWWRKKDWL